MNPLDTKAVPRQRDVVRVADQQRQRLYGAVDHRRRHHRRGQRGVYAAVRPAREGGNRQAALHGAER